MNLSLKSSEFKTDEIQRKEDLKSKIQNQTSEECTLKTEQSASKCEMVKIF